MVSERPSTVQNGSLQDAFAWTGMPWGSRLPGSALASEGVMVMVTLLAAALAGAARASAVAVSVPAAARDPRSRLTFIVRDSPSARRQVGTLLDRGACRARLGDELGPGHQALPGGSLRGAGGGGEQRLGGLGVQRAGVGLGGVR